MLIINTPYAQEDMVLLYLWFSDNLSNLENGKVSSDRVQPTIFILPNSDAAAFFYKDLVYRIRK